MKERFTGLRDWYKYRFHWEDYVLPVVIISLIILLVGAAHYSGEKRIRLMNECMKDGFKEYQCEGILNGNEGNTPIIVPVRVGR